MGNVTKICDVNVADLVPYERNAKIHSDDQIRRIMESIQEFGFLNPILIDKHRNVIAGHGRLEAAKELGLVSVPCVYIDGLTEEQRKAYIIADNKLTELGEWDMDLVVDELSFLDDFGFDTTLTGFDLNFGSDWFDSNERFAYTEADAENEEYNEFLEKFEDKKTTDDCYTPDNIYGAVVEYVEKQYGVNRKDFVRPFYPGGDYQSFIYKSGAVVVDNPPFSILSEIRRFYIANGIKYFLFAPALTVLGSNVGDCALCLCSPVMYANGASVSTSFVTNMEDGVVCKSSPELYKAIKEQNDANVKSITKNLPTFEYPKSVITATMVGAYSKRGLDYALKKNEVHFVRGLDCQQEYDKSIFGGGVHNI